MPLTAISSALSFRLPFTKAASILGTYHSSLSTAFVSQTV
jgi:hypothetical protein